MVAVPILGLPSITPPLTGNEQFPLVQGGATKRASINDIFAAVPSGFVPSSTQIIAGAGLEGGGPLTGNVTLSVADTGVVATTYGDGMNVPQFTVNSRGQITAAANIPITISGFSFVNSVSGTPNEIDVTAGFNPVVSLATALYFGGKTVSGGTFYNMVVNNITVSGGTEQGVTYNGPVISGGTAQGLTVSGGTIWNAVVNSPTVSGGTWQGGTLSGPVLNNPTINNVTISGSTFNNSTFNNPTVSGGTLQGFTASGGTLTNPLVVQPTVSGGVFQNITLSGTTAAIGASAIVVGNSATISSAAGGLPPLQSHGSIAAYRWNAGAGGANFVLVHSRGATVGTQGALQNGDTLGTINFQGSDGTNFVNNVANIISTIDNTVSGSALPANLSFQTQNLAGTAVERLRLTSSGSVGIAPSTATPAGGSSTRLIFGNTAAGFGIYFGSGVPTVSAAQGSWYMRSDGSTTSSRAYVNTGGTWVPMITDS